MDYQLVDYPDFASGSTVNCRLFPSAVDFVRCESLELALPGAHLLVGETEMMADFMQQSELDLEDEFLSGETVVEKRLPVEEDDIGQDVAVPAAALVEGDPGVEAVESVATGIEAEVEQDLLVGPLLDLDRDVAHEFGEFVGELIEGVGYDLFEGPAIDGEP